MPISRRPRRLLPIVLVAAIGCVGLISTSAGAGDAGREPPARPVQLTGTLVDAHGDDLEGGIVQHGFVLRAENGTMIALDQVPPDAAHGLVGSTVTVRGNERGGRVEVAPGGIAAAGGSGGASGSGGTAAALAPGAKTVAVVLVNFTDDTRQPWTEEQARSVVFDGTTSVNAYYQDASDGQVSVTGDVFGWVTITKDNVGCDWSQWGTDARAAALAAGHPLGNYTYTVYAWPRTTLCGWAGLGYLPGTSSYVDGYLDTRVVGHELGHNFGVHHASTMSCTDASGAPVPLSATCSLSEYGDPFSIMGSSTRLHHNWHRAQLGWQMGTVTASTSTTVTLAPADSGTGTRMVRVPRGDGTYLNLEYRQPTGLFDTFGIADAVVSGVSIRIAPEVGTITQSKLIDVTPTISGSFGDSTLRSGASFTDPLTGTSIVVGAVTADGAEVSVVYGPDTVAPSTPTGLTATTVTTSATSSSATLRWNASTDDRAVAGYRIYRGGAEVATTTSLTFTDSSLTPGGSYTFGVEAFDADDNRSGRATITISMPTLDTIAPTTPTELTVTVAKSRTVTLKWAASFDAVGVTSYIVTRTSTGAGASRTFTVTGTSATDKPGRGSFTYTVVAVDAAGNRSTAAATAAPVTIK